MRREYRFSAKVLSTVLCCLVVGACTARVSDANGGVGSSESALSLPGSFSPRIPVTLPIAERATGSGMLCRMAMVVDEQVAYLRDTWLDLGVSRSHVRDVVEASSRHKREMCGEGGRISRSRIHAAQRDLDDATRQMADDVAAAHDVDERIAMRVLLESTRMGAENLMQLCGRELSEVGQFVAFGGDVRPLSSLCSGSVGSVSESVSGGNAAGGVGVAQCVAGATAELINSCDPVAGGGDDESPLEVDRDALEEGIEEAEKKIEEAQEELERIAEDQSEAAQQRAEELQRDIDRAKMEVQAFRLMLETNEWSTEEILGAAAGLVLAVAGVVGGVVALSSTLTGLGAVVVLAEFFSAIAGLVKAVDLINEGIRAHREGILNDCSTMGFVTQGGDVMMFRDSQGRGMGIGDALYQCLCDNTGADVPIIGEDASCGGPNSSRRECLLNPFGPDDSIRMECLLALEEDNDLWSPGDGADAICQVIDCPTGAEPIAGRDDACYCEDLVDPGVDDGLADRCEATLCPSGSKAIPTPDGGCSCDAGSAGVGGSLPGFDLGEEPDTPWVGGFNPLPPPPVW